MRGGDALRDGASRDAARLQQDDRPVDGKSRRHTGGLARTGLRRDNNGARLPQTIGNRTDERIYRKGFEARGYALVTLTPTGQLTPVPPRPQ